jgi:hypothetical protein
LRVLGVVNTVEKIDLCAFPPDLVFAPAEEAIHVTIWWEADEYYDPDATR